MEILTMLLQLFNTKSFKCKPNNLGNPPADGALKNMKIVSPLKYLSNFFGDH